MVSKISPFNVRRYDVGPLDKSFKLIISKVPTGVSSFSLFSTRSINIVLE
ncbi:MAG: hypothetical protein Q4P19_08340 [Methanobrevibacter smithii]|nr:hypothetical protein [Methanobrevibacter smithii]MDO5831074.1 hypothetical protein [Methanobrevibacter smithii]